MFPFQRVPSFVPRDPTPEPIETTIARSMGQRSHAAIAARAARQGSGQGTPPPAVPVLVESAAARQARQTEAVRRAAAANPILAAHLARRRAARAR